MVLSQNFFFLFVSLTSLAISELIEDACFQNLLLLLRGRGRGRLRYWRRGAWQGYKLLLWPVCLSHCFAVAIVIYFSFFIAWSSANKFLMSRRKRTKQNITEKTLFTVSCSTAENSLRLLRVLLYFYGIGYMQSGSQFSRWQKQPKLPNCYAHNSQARASTALWFAGLQTPCTYEYDYDYDHIGPKTMAES